MRKMKQCLCGLLTAACIITQLPLDGLTMTAAAGQDYGIATGLAASASRDDQGHVASNVNDGDDGSRWYDGDNVNDGNWVMIDLGEVKEVGKVRLNWGEDPGVYPQAYKIQISEHDGDYQDLCGSDSAPVQAVEEYEVAGSGRYIRMLVEKHGTWGTSLYELNVWEAQPEQPGPPEQPGQPDAGGNIVKFEAEGAMINGSAAVTGSGTASGGQAVAGLDGAGSSVTFRNLPACDRVTVCYSSPNGQENGKIGLYINGVRTELPIVNTESGEVFLEYTAAVQIPENASVAIQHDEGDVPVVLDYIRIPGLVPAPGEEGRYEAEGGMLVQGDLYQAGVTQVHVRELEAASGGKYVDGFQESGNGAGVLFPEVVPEDGTYELSLGYARYFYEQTDKISIYVNGVKVHQLDLVSKGSNVDDTIASAPITLELLKGDTVGIRVDADAGEGGKLRLDYLQVQPVKDTPAEETKDFQAVIRTMAGDRLTVPVSNLPDGESLIYSSEDDTIAAVDAGSGEITALAAGNVNVIAQGTADPEIRYVYRLEIVETEEELILQAQTAEAEEGTLLQGANTSKEIFVRNDGMASGGKCVDGFYDSGDGAGVEFPIAVPEEGKYSLELGYARDSYLVGTDTMTLKVNGEAKEQFRLLPRSNYSDYGQAAPVTVTLSPNDRVSVCVDKENGDAGLLRMDYIKVKRDVLIPPRGIRFTEKNIQVFEKESLEIAYGLSPEGAGGQLIWESGDEGILTVDQGMLRAHAAGSTTVTVRSAYRQEIMDTMNVTVVANDRLDTLDNGKLAVMIDKSFPRAVEYRLASGAVMKGNTGALHVIKINGKEYEPEVDYTGAGESAEYVLHVKELEAAVTIKVTVEDTVLKWDVTEIKESGDPSQRIFTFEIPDQRIVSVDSGETEAAFAGSVVESNIETTGDHFIDLTKVKEADASPEGYAYAFISNGQVAAGIRSNAMDTKILKQTAADGSSFNTALWSGAWRYRADDYTKTFQDTEGKYGEKGKVVTRTYQADYTEELPLLYVVLAEDINGSGKVDWQDAAVEFRKVMPLALGMEEIPDAVVQRLVFPQSGEGNYPFIASLDETKRMYLQTDGLGQLVLNKYHNEGTWGDFNTYDDRLGGLRDFRKYVSDASGLYNSWVGVHTNFTEIYPKAESFRPESIIMKKDGVTPQNGGYQAYGYWLQQVYTPDVTFEAITRERQQRLIGFKNEVPGLGFVYSDVFSGGGWKGRRLAEDYKAAGLAYFVEWPYQNEEEAVWSHWAVEKVYSPPSLKAYASDIARFIFNHTKDRWDNNSEQQNRYPNSCNLLMGADTTTYEGWPQATTNNSFNQAVRVTFDNNLPTKYMQHFPILRMDKDEDGWAVHIWFEDGVEVFKDPENGGKRTISKDGKIIYRQDSYLIPWDEGDIHNPEGEKKEVKLYHWNENGGESTWELPVSWSGVENVILYELTDQGKKSPKTVPVVNGSVTLSGIKEKTPYVVYKEEASPEPDMNYGDGGYVADPGFNYGDLRRWTVEKGLPLVKKNDTEFDDPNTPGWGRNAPYGEQRNYEMIVDSPEETVVSQVITGLEPGEYAASVMVEIQQGKTRKAVLETECAGVARSNYADQSILLDYDEYDSKIGTYMLRMRTVFTVPEGTTEAVIRLRACEGQGKVRFDNVRVYDTTVPEAPEDTMGKTVLYQDFEYAVREGITGNDMYKPTYEGYYPFNLGGSNGIHETRISIQKRHDPYGANGADEPWDPNTAKVDDVLSGERSLKILGTGIGIALQSTPQTIRFEKDRTYRVSFDYQVMPEDDYAFVVGDGKEMSGKASKPDNIIHQSVLEATSKTKHFVMEFTAGSDQEWIGFYRTKQTYSVSVDPTPLVIDGLLVEDLSAVFESRDALQAFCDKYKDMEQGNYTSGSFEDFRNALENARRVLDHDNSAYEVLEASMRSLQEAFAGLTTEEEPNPPEAENYTVKFHIIPENASITVMDAQGREIAPTEGRTYTLKAGGYRYTASAEGYDTITASITVKGDETISVELEKAAVPEPDPAPGDGGGQDNGDGGSGGGQDNGDKGDGGSDLGSGGQNSGNSEASGQSNEIKAPGTGDPASFGWMALVMGLGTVCVAGAALVWRRKKK